MNWINRLSIGQRMTLLVGGGATTVLGLAAFAAYCANTMHTAAMTQPALSPQAMEAVRSGLVQTATLIGVGSLVLLVPAFWWITRSIIARLKEAQTVLGHVAQGDLARAVPVSGGDEVGQLLQGIEQMRLALTGVISQVRSSSDSMHTAVSEIASGNQDLSQRTEAQAASLQQTTASLQSMSDFLATNADTSQQASRLATEASGLAQQGSAAVMQLVQRMREISQQSSRIGEIISTIDGIAFQTNILALNASVESARAGEHGRGFAVVAGEVRMLAQRCSDAAKEIKGLIQASGNEVERGVKEAEQAGGAMGKLYEAVTGTTGLIGEVNQATAGQAAAVSQLHAEVHRLDNVTQQNAALVEQAAAAAQSVQQQSEALVKSVSTFKIDTRTVATV